jgi:hypothetical protein
MDPAQVSADLPPPDRGAWPHLVGSFVAHLMVLGVSALLVGPLGELSLDAAPEMPRYDGALPCLRAEAEPTEPEITPTTLAPRDPDEKEPAESRCGETKGGSMGHPDAAVVARRYGVRGPIDNADPHVSHSADDTEDSFPSMFTVGPFSRWGGDRDAPTAPWGRDDSLGNDATSARGHLWGEETGTALGSPGTGVGLSIACDTCGASGRGVSLRGTAPGGPTGTELSSRAAQARPLAR